MNARVCVAATAVGTPWAACLTYVAIAALHEDVPPMPEGVRDALLSALLTGTLALALVFNRRRLVAELRRSHGLDIPNPRPDPTPEPGCRNTPPATPELKLFVGRAEVRHAFIDDSPTLDLGPMGIDQETIAAARRILSRSRRSYDAQDQRA